MWGGSQVLGLIQEYRLCWICGRFSGGKTSLAYRLAYDWLRRGYRLVTTNASVWGEPYENVKLQGDPPKLRAVVILDEGGLYFKASAQIEQVAAFAAKMDCIYLIPSFFPPSKAAQVVTVQPVFGFRAAGIPLIVYTWRTKLGAFDDRGYFIWWRPSEIYGVYSRQDPGAQPDEIVEWLIDKSEEYQAWFRAKYDRKERKNTIRGVDVTWGASGSSGLDIIADAASAFADAADTISVNASISRRGRRRK